MNYNSNFQDNIPASMFNSTSKNILEWILNNRDAYDWAKDPNAYEMANVFLFAGKYSHEGKDINIDTLSQIWDIRSKDFAGCNISESSFIYLICQDAYQAAVNGESIVNDENSHHALRKMAGIGLYLKQQQRDTGKTVYNNPQELLSLLQCSDTLKALHPDLFKRYAFEKNLDVLCKLQLSQELPPEVADSIKNAQNAIYSREGSAIEETPSGSKRYLCSKIIDDATKICDFLRSYEQKVDLKNGDTSEYGYSSPANSYYYSLYYELSHARSALVRGSCSLEDFNKNFESILNKYNVDLNVLLYAVNKISHLEVSPNRQEQQEFIDSLEGKAIAHFNSRKKGNEETEQ